MEVQKGVWHWEAPHPEWRQADWERQDVSSYAVDTPERLLLFDPIALPHEIEVLAQERETAIVLTSTWHRRDARTLSDRLDAPIYTPPPDREPDPVQGNVFKAGDRLAIGVEAFPGREEPHDLMLWVESRRALVAGDTLVDRGHGLELLDEWLPEGVTRDQVLEALQPLLELPVEIVLPTHGAPTDRAALVRALSQ
jgi:glyoxylase-like metal-dependent hydrolase (beta-lactamase superfamily II)